MAGVNLCQNFDFGSTPSFSPREIMRLEPAIQCAISNVKYPYPAFDPLSPLEFPKLTRKMDPPPIQKFHFCHTPLAILSFLVI